MPGSSPGRVRTAPRVLAATADEVIIAWPAGEYGWDLESRDTAGRAPTMYSIEAGSASPASDAALRLGSHSGLVAELGSSDGWVEIARGVPGQGHVFQGRKGWVSARLRGLS